MKLLKVDSGVPRLYSLSQLRKDNPNTSLPKEPSVELLAKYGVFPFSEPSDPVFDPETERLGDREFIQGPDGTWELRSPVVTMTVEEAQARKALLKQQVSDQRLESYQSVADPLYFKWQAGEATKEEWLAARELVRRLYLNDN